MTPRQRFGFFLRQARERAELTQLEVARELGWSTAQFVSNFERGISSPPLKAVPTLCKLLGISRSDYLRALDEYHHALVREQMKRARAVFEGEARC